MQASSEKMRGEAHHGFYLSNRTISKIQTFCNIAKANNASISLEELLSLVPLEVTEKELANAWQKCPTLSDDYAIAEGVIEEKPKQRGANDSSSWMVVDEGLQQRRRQRTIFNMQHADMYRAWIGNNDIVTLAVSGSTSYQSASETDDLDFFLVARNEAMWICLTRSLILARIFKLSRRNAPSICLSFVANSHLAELHFATNRNALIAREALSAKLLLGYGYYANLLKKNSWIGDYYPKLYESFFNSNRNDQTTSRRGRTSSLKRIIDLFLYKTVGTYIKIKSDLLNRRLMKQGISSSVFEPRIGKDHCIYESKRYRQLKKMYSKLD